MEHTIHTLVMSFINEQKNYHAIHGVWEDDARDDEATYQEIVIEFLHRTIDEDTAQLLINGVIVYDQYHDPIAEEDLGDAYDTLSYLFEFEPEIYDMNYKN